MSDGEWKWQFRTPAKRTYDDLDEHAQDRITDKLDEIVTDQWRDPDDYLEPLTGAPTRSSESASSDSVPSVTTESVFWIFIRSNTAVGRTKLTTIDFAVQISTVNDLPGIDCCIDALRLSLAHLLVDG